MTVRDVAAAVAGFLAGVVLVVLWLVLTATPAVVVDAVGVWT